MTPLIPSLKELAAEGQYGRQKINQLTHYLTVPIAILQGYGQLNLLQSGGLGGAHAQDRFECGEEAHGLVVGGYRSGTGERA